MIIAVDHTANDFSFYLRKLQKEDQCKVGEGKK